MASHKKVCTSSSYDASRAADTSCCWLYEGADGAGSGSEYDPYDLEGDVNIGADASAGLMGDAMTVVTAKDTMRRHCKKIQNTVNILHCDFKRLFTHRLFTDKFYRNIKCKFGIINDNELFFVMRIII